MKNIEYIYFFLFAPFFLLGFLPDLGATFSASAAFFFCSACAFFILICAFILRTVLLLWERGLLLFLFWSSSLNLSFTFWRLSSALLFSSNSTFLFFASEILLNIKIPVMFIYIFTYPNNSRDVYLYIYWVSAYMG